MHPRLPLIVSGLVGLVLLVSACGGATANRVSQPPSRLTAARAFAGCMRSHGVPNFPDPNSQGDFPTFHSSVPKQTANAANDACKHLLSSGGSQATPQQRQEKLAFGVKVAECLRKHGYPNFPDPTGLGSQQLPPGIDPNSPQFQTAETGCEKQEQKALGLR